VGAGFKHHAAVGQRQVLSSVPQNSVETRQRKRQTASVQSTVYLSLGANVGDRLGNLNTAIERLRNLGQVVSVSSFYETEPVEFTAQPWFVNCAVKLKTDKTPQQLLTDILELEQQMGRQRTQNKGPRVIDIDILLFGDSVLDTKDLTIPHPALHERRFVLEPLAEIAPDLQHQSLKQTVRKLRDSLPAGQVVRKIEA